MNGHHDGTTNGKRKAARDQDPKYNPFWNRGCLVNQIIIKDFEDAIYEMKTIDGELTRVQTGVNKYSRNIGKQTLRNAFLAIGDEGDSTSIKDIERGRTAKKLDDLIKWVPPVLPEPVPEDVELI
jgi:hypothetical protein